MSQDAERANMAMPTVKERSRTPASMPGASSEYGAAAVGGLGCNVSKWTLNASD
jgi:hypothetical protein